MSKIESFRASWIHHHRMEAAWKRFWQQWLNELQQPIDPNEYWKIAKRFVPCLERIYPPYRQVNAPQHPDTILWFAFWDTMDKLYNFSTLPQFQSMWQTFLTMSHKILDESV